MPNPTSRAFDPATLRMFVAVCEERNIARAGEREAIVASAISKRVAALEAQLGIPLLTRKRRGIEPTAAGEALLRHARDILGAMERMHAELGEFASGVHGSIRVMASLSALSEFLPDDVGRFLIRHKSLRVSLDERVSTDIVRGVRDGSADLGVCWDAGNLAALKTVPYRSDHLCLVAPASHPLARLRKISFGESLAFEHVEILSTSIVQMTLKRAAEKQGKALRQRIQVSTFEAACRSVAAGLGISVVPDKVAESFATTLGLRLVPLTDAWAERRFVVCMRAPEMLSEPARMLVDYLGESAKHASKAARG